MKNTKNQQGAWLAIGIGAGVALGVALGNVGVGIALGVVFSIAMESSQKHRSGGDDNGQ